MKQSIKHQKLWKYNVDSSEACYNISKLSLQMDTFMTIMGSKRIVLHEKLQKYTLCCFRSTRERDRDSMKYNVAASEVHYNRSKLSLL